MMQNFFPAIMFLVLGCSGMNEHAVSEVFEDQDVALLASAACEGDVQQVRDIVSAGVSANAFGTQGITPLIWALRCENLAGVSALLDAGANPNQSADRFVIPLSVSAVIENSEFTKLLLEAGADANGLTDDVVSSPLMRALSLGTHTDNWDNYELILNSGADINLAYGPNKNTVASRAVGYGRYHLAVELVERGYRYDLAGLRAAAELLRANEEQAKHKTRLLELLDEIEQSEKDG